MRPTRGMVVSAVTAFAVTACSDGAGSLGPDASQELSLDGDWSYVATDLAGDFFGERVTCQYEFDMRLSVMGATFDGTYRRALLTCVLFGEHQPVDAGDGDIVSGSLTGSAVQFDVDTERVRNTGTLTRDGMSGHVSVELIVQRDAAIDTVRVVGGWEASR